MRLDATALRLFGIRRLIEGAVLVRLHTKALTIVGGGMAVASAGLAEWAAHPDQAVWPVVGAAGLSLLGKAALDAAKNDGATAATDPSIYDMPFWTDEFVDRVDFLKAGRKFVRRRADPRRPRTLVVSGPSGFGKSRTAYEIVTRNAQRYQAVWYVPAERREGAEASLSDLAFALGLKEASWERLRAQLWQELARRGRWMLFYDNVESPDLLEDLWPRRGGGEVLITSRRSDWHGRADQVLTLPPLETDAATQLFAAGRRTAELETAETPRLAQLLGGRPLDLIQVSRQMAATGSTVTANLASIRARSAVATDDAGDDKVGSVTIDFDALGAAEPSALALLTVLVWFAADEIPGDALMGRHAATAGDMDLSAAVADADGFVQAVDALERWGLLSSRGTQRISVHRDIRSAVRSQATENRCAAAVRILAEAFPADPDNPAFWSDCDRLLPHALEAAEAAERQSLEPIGRGQVFHLLGRYLHQRDEMKRALSMLHRAVLAYRQADDAEGEAVVRSTMAVVHLDLTDLAAGEYEARQALSALTRPQPVLDTSLTLAMILREQVRLDEAEQVLQNALQYAEPIGREFEVHTQLANVARRAGMLGTALTQAREAAMLTERDRGAESFETGEAQRILGLSCIDAELYDEAREALYRSANVLHAISSVNAERLALKSEEHCAFVCTILGRLDEAKTLFEHVLTTRVDDLGPDHPIVASIHAFHAEFLLASGDPTSALAELTESQRIYSAAYPPEHPYLTIPLVRMAPVLAALGRLDEAESHAHEALRRRRAAYGDDHPLTAEAYRGLAEALRAEGNQAGARTAQAQAVAAIAAAVSR